MSDLTKRRSGYLAVCALVALVPLALDDFRLGLLSYIGIQAIAVLGLVVLTGAGGLSSFGQAAFMGVGAYATAYYTTSLGGSPWLGLPLSLGISGLIALAIGVATLRLEGHFLPLSTVAWGIALYYLFGSLDVLGGYNGIPAIRPIPLPGIEIQSPRTTYYFVAAVLLLAMLGCANLLDSRPGRAIRGLKGGRILVESLGISVFGARLAAFVACGVLAGLSGWLFAHTERFVSPTPFDVRPGIELVFMALVGGVASVWGAVIGAAVVIFLKNGLQDVLPYVGDTTGQLEIVFFGAAFVLLLHRARRGLVPWIARRFRRRPRTLDHDAAPLPRRNKPTRGTTVLELKEATKRFGGLVAVSKVSAEVTAGEILGVIGPNGAGKSTLFYLISGVLPLTSGSVQFCGRPITASKPEEIARAGLARTFQHVRLLPKMTVLENAAMGCHMRTSTGYAASTVGADAAAEASVFREAYEQLVRVGLGDKAHALAESLSLGEQRILEIARALAADPVLLLLDEPAAGLRRMEKQALRDLLRSLRDEGLSILIVEHDMQFVMSLVDRIMVMDFGTKIAEDLPQQIRSDARVKEAYLGAA